MTLNDLDVIQEKIGYKFKNAYLLIQAFTRKSFSAENRKWEDNEKLEFVGDKVLDFIVIKKLTSIFGFASETLAQSLDSINNGEKIEEKNIVDKMNFEFVHTEGEMTEIKKSVVQTKFLSQAIERLGLEKYLLMGKGDIKSNVQNEPHVKEDLFEAIIGAVAIDSSWDIAVLESVIDGILNINHAITYGIDDGTDYISAIQNWYQKEYKKEPEYVFYQSESNEVFECYLTLTGYSQSYFEGFGYSKKEAIKLAAKRAYTYLKEKNKFAQTVFDVIGKFDYNTSINKLQMLVDKKIIKEVRYDFSEETSDKNNGNPEWTCRCIVDGVDELIEYTGTKKQDVKKIAAYTALKILTGRDVRYDYIEKHHINVNLNLQNQEDNKNV